MIQQVVKLERDPAAKMTAAQQVVKAAWDRWREDSTASTRAVSTARTAVTNAIGPAVASLTQPGQPAFEPATFEGELVSKDVAIDGRRAESAGRRGAEEPDLHADARGRHPGRSGPRRPVDHHEDRRRVTLRPPAAAGLGCRVSGPGANAPG